VCSAAYASKAWPTPTFFVDGDSQVALVALLQEAVAELICQLQANAPAAAAPRCRSRLSILDLSALVVGLHVMSSRRDGM
jgi:hypothetical protein